MVKEILNKIGKKVALLALLIIPTVSAYPIQYDSINLWDVFVEAVFGGFWFSVFGLAIVMLILMSLVGNLSRFTITIFVGLFVLAMAIGYTTPLIIIPLWGGLVFWSVREVVLYLQQT